MSIPKFDDPNQFRQRNGPDKCGNDYSRRIVWIEKFQRYDCPFNSCLRILLDLLRFRRQSTLRNGKYVTRLRQTRSNFPRIAGKNRSGNKISNNMWKVRKEIMNSMEQIKVFCSGPVKHALRYLSLTRPFRSLISSCGGCDNCLKRKMLLKTQLDCGMLLCFVISLSLVGFASATKCTPEKCGDSEVSYPFYIYNSDCGYPGFQINCTEDKDTGELALYLPANVSKADVEDFRIAYYKIWKIDYSGYIVIDSTSLKASSCGNGEEADAFRSFLLLGPFYFSMYDKFVVVGSNAIGNYTYADGIRGEARCATSSYPQIPPYCRYGCCEITFPDDQYAISFSSEGQSVTDIRYCGFSTIMDPSTFTGVHNKKNLSWPEIKNAHYGLRVNWGVGQYYDNCYVAKNTGSYSCSTHSKCLVSPSRWGHVCKCLPGYEGNGYFNGTGCTDINECQNRTWNKCVEAEKGGICRNLEGSYNCSCAKGYKGDGFHNGTRCSSTRLNAIVLPAIAGSVSSFVVVSIAASLLVWWLKKRHLRLLEAKYFHQLQQYIASTGGRESLRLFSARELARASNQYSNDMVLGSGGFGTVFKGILLDGTLVAIKKSKQAFSLEDNHDFLNEVTILSQINHRNIVKLLGCCIQTKNPMLVSEFVSNGTLFEHLQSNEGCLPWASRLQIAIETGEALAYLHSGASQPIFHRDVKSSNILLNETFSPKVADFGISRLISAANNTHLTTNIMGTRGYLDPEYFQTYQLTDKSDVYSFGVVLVELITGLEPLSAERISEQCSLSNLFLTRFNQNGLREILDSRILEEDNLQQMEDIGRLARACLHLERRKRPSMKEVVEELLWVRDGARKKKFHDNLQSDDAISEHASTSIELSQTSYMFRSYTFPSTNESTSEEPFTALIEMSTKSNELSSKESMSGLF